MALAKRVVVRYVHNYDTARLDDPKRLVEAAPHVLDMLQDGHAEHDVERVIRKWQLLANCGDQAGAHRLDPIVLEQLDGFLESAGEASGAPRLDSDRVQPPTQEIAQPQAVPAANLEDPRIGGLSRYGRMIP